MSVQSFHVMIIGGGIGGLCLAQGLKKAGIRATVYERDRTPTARLQGYRIHINPSGNKALHSCLPEHLFKIYLDTCGKAGSRYSMYTEQMKELFTINTERSTHDPIQSHKSVSRMTLRQVLLAELGERVEFNKHFVRYEEADGGKITAVFEDGSAVTGNVLIAADGVNSKVRKQFLPHAELLDTQILNIIGKVELNDTSRALLPDHLFEGPGTIMAPGGTGMFIAVHETGAVPGTVPFSIGSNDSTYGDRPDLLFDNTKDYIMWAYISKKEKYSFNKKEPIQLSNDILKKEIINKTQKWDDRLQTLIELTDVDSLLPVAIRSSIPVPRWQTRPITLLGDAIHSMTPFRGIGANVALRDAELLCNELIAVHHGKKRLLQGMADYETQMLKYGFSAVRSSLKTAQQSVSDNKFAFGMMKLAFRTMNNLAPLKNAMARGFGDL